MKKQDKENNILFGLIELYIKNGRPIGSNTLKESGFDHLSSATIRNYFFKLEESGYLTQQHVSGGRLPTEAAYKFYINHPSDKEYFGKAKKKALEKSLFFEGKEVVSYFHQIVSVLSELTGCAVWISTPRFDQDFIIDIKLLMLDHQRLLCIVLTSFGMVHTEVFYTETKPSNFSIKRVEAYLHFLRTGLDRPNLDEEELKLAEHLHREILLKHIAGHTSFTQEDIYKTGFSKLLEYEEMQDSATLANTLALFEHPGCLPKLCEETRQENHIKVWIGDDLQAYTQGICHASMILAPYSIREKPVGALGLLGPTRIPYKLLIEILRYASELLTATLTTLLFKHHMTYRIAQTPGLNYQEAPTYLADTQKQLIEDYSKPINKDLA
ncbi:MAG: heat-inducible transcriptional repressor HrcA [Chlamydiae bacterium]|nr:heat-inducible transcriptional repressor HrcA [Chlamydiota bacterium]